MPGYGLKKCPNYQPAKKKKKTRTKKKSKGIDWDQLQVFALGEMGMTVQEFDFITLRELSNKMEGFTHAKQRKRDADFWNVRWQTTHLINIQLGKNEKIKPTDLFVFDWEDVAPKIPTPERQKELREIVKKWSNPNNKKRAVTDNDLDKFKLLK